jgi:hypothetical protein
MSPDRAPSKPQETSAGHLGAGTRKVWRDLTVIKDGGFSVSPAPRCIYLRLLSRILAAGERVIARAPDARVIAKAAIDGVITCVSVDCVIVSAAAQSVVITGPTTYGIVPSISRNVVYTGSSEQRIVVISAAQSVVALVTTDAVIAGKAIGLIIATQKSNDVGVVGAIYRIVSSSTFLRRSQPIACLLSLGRRRTDDESYHDDYRRKGGYCRCKGDGHPEKPRLGEIDVPVANVPHVPPHIEVLN